MYIYICIFIYSNQVILYTSIHPYIGTCFLDFSMTIPMTQDFVKFRGSRRLDWGEGNTIDNIQIKIWYDMIYYNTTYVTLLWYQYDDIHIHIYNIKNNIYFYIYRSEKDKRDCKNQPSTASHFHIYIYTSIGSHHIV